MKVRVNQESCVGCGACLGASEDLFEIGDDGLSHAKVSDVPVEKENEAKEAVNACPTGAIEVE